MKTFESFVDQIAAEITKSDTVVLLRRTLVKIYPLLTVLPSVNKEIKEFAVRRGADQPCEFMRPYVEMHSMIAAKGEGADSEVCESPALVIAYLVLFARLQNLHDGGYDIAGQLQPYPEFRAAVAPLLQSLAASVCVETCLAGYRKEDFLNLIKTSLELFND